MSAALTPMPQRVSLEALSFGDLVTAIRHVNDELTAQATRAVNTSLTLRNWLIGYYVEAYERRGVDRAQYGDKLMEKLAESLTQQGMSRCDRREIYRYRQFYLTYPQIVESLPPQFALAVRDPYVFEFLGLTPPEVMSESHLEEQLIRKIEAFLLELGHDFCFEARQKRILIGDTHYFVDLVFYHRILKCHVLVELKLAEFNHENIGQLNTYVSWYRQKMMATGDNPPIGILLCTHKSASLAEFALAGMDNQLFVSKYQLELPKREEIERFLTEKLREAGLGNPAQKIQGNAS